MGVAVQRSVGIVNVPLHINSAQAPLNPEDGCPLVDTYLLYTVHMACNLYREFNLSL